VNKWCRAAVAAPHSVEQRVEALYAWDVHTNATVASSAVSLLALYAVAPLALAPGLTGTLLGNGLWVCSQVAYLYVSFWGYAGEINEWGLWFRDWCFHLAGVPHHGAVALGYLRGGVRT